MTDSRPIVVELTPPPDPVLACERFEGLPYRVFLDSASARSPFSRYAFLVADPVAVVRARGRRTEILAGAEAPRQSDQDALSVIQQWLAAFETTAIDGLPPFQAGAAGYIGYEYGRLLEKIPEAAADDLALPDLVFGLYDCVV